MTDQNTFDLCELRDCPSKVMEIADRYQKGSQFQYNLIRAWAMIEDAIDVIEDGNRSTHTPRGSR
jgi:hypothetical protein